MQDESKISSIGRTNGRLPHKKFGIYQRDRLFHMYAIGKTGAGKSTLLESLALQDIREGRGLAVIDPHGDLAERLSEQIPESRRDDLIYLDAADPSQPYGYNPLRRIQREKIPLAASKTCPKTSLREDVIVHRIIGEIGRMHLCDETLAALIEMFHIHISELQSEKGTMEKSLHLSLAQAKDRLERLTDAYLDRAVDRESFESRKTTLHNEILEIEERLRQFNDGDAEYVKREQNFLELLKNLQILTQLENTEKKRDILKKAISNLTVSGKNVDIDWDIPLQRMVSEPIPQYGAPWRNSSLTARNWWF